MQGLKKTRDQLEAENNLLRQGAFGKNITAIFLAIVKYGALVLCFYYGSGAIISVADNLAGKETYADIDINTELKAEGNLSLNDISQTKSKGNIMCLIVGGLGFVVGMVSVRVARLQSNLRKDTVEKLQDKIRSYETVIDPKRSTSKLTNRGETRPEDR